MSHHSTHTRRSVVKAVGATAAAGLFTGAVGAVDTDDRGLDVVESPTGNTLHDVESTAAGAFAVGGGGVVLERTAVGWRKLLDGGPTGNGNNLYGADVTDDGERLWFVGASGAIGEYDVEAGVLNDRSAPMDVTNNFNDVSVTGEAGEANVYVAGDSGKVYHSDENGETGSWDYTTPGSGAAINAIDFFDDRSGHVVDGNTTVFYTRDGATWDRLGIADANHNFYGVDSDDFDDVWVSGAGGTVYHWNGSEWARSDTGDATLRDVEVGDGGAGATVGGGGKYYATGGSEWTVRSTPTGQNLKAVLRGDTTVAVGAGGTVLEG
ncbi:WD40/YVTN/BNR-like repeat-containing protein [Halobacterium hubeiense]|uniref:WD40/YVTN/BNR-like repeat-containing protein n=1 Tax=Halobacterium hubeiense TaxID=1407499 RepID=UPI003C749EBE